MSFIIKFKDRNQEPAAKFVDCSNKVISLYELQYNDKHIVNVVKTGEVNIYEKIQTYANDSDFSKLIRNIELTHDISLYTAKSTGYNDASNLPSNATEMMIQTHEAALLKDKVLNDEFTKSKGIPFKEFIKNYSEKEHYEFLKNKYEKKEVGE